MGQLTEDVLLLKGFDQGALVLVGNEIAAVLIFADAQDIVHVRVNGLVAHHAPEGILVLVGGSGLLGRGLAIGGVGLIGNGAGSRTIQLQIEGLLTLHALDGLAHLNDFGLHLVIGGGVLGRQKAVGILTGLDECLGGFPQLHALFAHLTDFTHS